MPPLIASLRGSARLKLAIELCLLLILALSAPQPIYDFNPDVRVRGPEFSYLLGTGEIARVAFQATGRLPLWNSWFGLGEPLLESGFSYILNPLMFFPVLAGGMVQGAKIAVIAHVGLMALGGWMLGYSLGLGRIGRLFLGLMLSSTGGLVGALGMGFYQMGLSQAYVPFVYAAVIGCLRRTERLWSGLLAVSGALLIFSGTFWYVLPTAIASALLVAFGVLKFQRDLPFIRLNWPAIRRLGVGVSLLIAIAMIRLLPVLASFRLWWHSPEDYRTSYTFAETIARFFDSSFSYPNPSALFYFYAAPLAFVLTVLIIRALAHVVWQPLKREQWRIILPGLIAMLIFSLWSMVDTPFVRILYQLVPFLSEWRLLTRMSAATAVWLIALLALLLDDLIALFQRLWRSAALKPSARRFAAAVLVMLVTFAAVSVWDVRQNWPREAGTEPVVTFLQSRLFSERLARPNEFIQFDTWDFYDYTWFYPTLTRAWQGNPDYYPYSMPVTISNQQTMRWFSPAAIEFHDEYDDLLLRTGYEMDPADVGTVDQARVWRHPISPPYAFSVPFATLLDSRVDSLQAREVTPAHYQYQMDTVTLWVEPQDSPHIAVVTEVAYPGWQVNVNGTPRQLESVGGLLGVRLAEGEAAEIVFAYRPPTLYLGGVITIIGCLLTAIWLLRVDRLVKQLVSA